MMENNDERLKFYYVTEYGRYVQGYFNQIPKDIFVAEIVHSFSTKNKKGNIINIENSYKMFIGKVYSIKDLLKSDIDFSTESLLTEYVKEGHEYVVVPKGTNIGDRRFYSFNKKNDKVFDNYEDFKSSIQYLCENFESYNSDYKRKNKNKRLLLSKKKQVNYYN